MGGMIMTQDSASRIRVLLVDDQSFFLNMGQNLLRPRGYAVQTASNGREALQTAKSARPDAILLDVDNAPGSPVLRGNDRVRKALLP